MLYNRFSDIKLPNYLAFFGGRRFVPIVAGAVGLVLAHCCSAIGDPWLERGIDALSRAVVASGNFGLFAYGVLNRVLIVTGLHHIINNIAWFLLGDYHGVDRRPEALLRRRSDRRRVHGGLLPGHDVRPARRLPGHVPHRASGAAQGGRRACCCSIALTSFLTGRDRADRVHLHVPGAGAVRCCTQLLTGRVDGRS